MHNGSPPDDPPRRPRGRPRVEEPSKEFSIRLPPQTYDRLIDLAKREEQSVSATVRQLLILRLK
jgi:predicted HicB family RNase H-like nuclease